MPGDTDSQACGDCGLHARTCNASCTWGSWGTCTGVGDCCVCSSGSCNAAADNTQVPGCDGACQACQSGACGAAAAGTDPGNQCSISNNCATGNCMGGTAACGWNTTGDGACPACKTCSGATSIACVNRSNDTQDTTSPGTCSATCKKCSSGGCVNQTGSEDLFGHCSSAYAAYVVLNSASNSSCDTVCAGLSCNSGRCGDNTGACASSYPCSCQSVGTDAGATNSHYWSMYSGSCIEYDVGQCWGSCGVAGITCAGYPAEWTRCNCR